MRWNAEGFAGWFDGEKVNLSSQFANNQMVISHEAAHSDLVKTTGDGCLYGSIKADFWNENVGINNVSREEAKRFLHENSHISHEAYATYRGVQDLNSQPERDEALDKLPDSYQSYYSIFSTLVDDLVQSSAMRYAIATAVSNYLFSSNAMRVFVSSGLDFSSIIEDEFTPDWRLRRSFPWLLERLDEMLISAAEVTLTQFDQLDPNLNSGRDLIQYMDDDQKVRVRPSEIWYLDYALIKNLINQLIHISARDYGIESLYQDINDYGAIISDLASKSGMPLEIFEGGSEFTELASNVRRILSTSISITPFAYELQDYVTAFPFGGLGSHFSEKGLDVNSMGFAAIRFNHPQLGTSIGFYFFRLPADVINPMNSADSLFLAFTESGGRSVIQWLRSVCGQRFGMAAWFLVDTIAPTEEVSDLHSQFDRVLLYSSDLGNKITRPRKDQFFFQYMDSKSVSLGFHTAIFFFELPEENHIWLKVTPEQDARLLANFLTRHELAEWSNSTEKLSDLNLELCIQLIRILPAFLFRV